MTEIPVLPNHLPAIVSHIHAGQFLPVRKVSSSGYIRAGVFNVTQVGLDECIMSGFRAVKELGESYITSSLDKAIEFIRSESDIEETDVVTIIGSEIVSNMDLNKANVRFISCKVNGYVVLSIPEHVGIHIRFIDSFSSAIVFHNIRKGIAFVEPGHNPNT